MGITEWIIVVACAAAFVLLVMFTLGLVVFFMSAQKPSSRRIMDKETAEKLGIGHMKEEIDESLKMWEATNPETVHTTSFDGKRLTAKYSVRENPRATVILCHGWRSAPEFDFSCILKKYINMNFNILTIDQRSHGESEGKYITFGINESKDCVAWAKYIEERENGAHPVFVEGMSMGGTTVMMSAGRGLPACVKGIIADCGFTSPKEIICHVVRQRHLPAGLIFPFVTFWFRVLAKVDINEYSTVEAMKVCKLPIIFLHGEADTFVPCDMTRANYAACTSEKWIYTVPDAAHGMAYTKDPEACFKKMSEFFDFVLG